MGGLFSSPKIQAPAPAPPPPGPAAAEVQDAMKRERRRTASATGRASTVLTGGQGLTSEATTASKKLLGQ